MEITTFSCKNCGAAVDIPDSAGTVACTYCGSKHRVSFQDGIVIAKLTAKVRQLDEDLTRLKAGQVSREKTAEPGERLEMIEEGKRKWHAYFSSVKAGRSADSPEMLALFEQAQANLIGGYGPVSGPLVEDAYGAKLLGVDPPAGYSCLYMLLGIIVVSLGLGAVFLYESDMRNGIILMIIGAVGIVAGIPFVLLGIHVDKANIARRKTALASLDEIEREIRREIDVVRKK